MLAGVNGSKLKWPPSSYRTGQVLGNSVSAVPSAFNNRTPVSEGSPKPAPVELFGADEARLIIEWVINHTADI